MTTREQIKGYQEEILKGNLLPQRTAEMLVEISALIGSINSEILRTDMEYNLALKNALAVAKTASTAKIEVGTTKEYLEKHTARNAKEEAIEMMRSLKYMLKAFKDEYEASINL